MRLKLFDKIVNVAMVLLIALGMIGVIFLLFAPYYVLYVRAFMDLVLTSVMYKIIVAVLAILVLFLCGRILFVRVKERKFKNGIPVKITDQGTAFLTVAALETIILRVTMDNKQVSAARTTILPGDGCASIGVTVALKESALIPEVTKNLTESLKYNVERITGVAVNEIHIVVEQSGTQGEQGGAAMPVMRAQEEPVPVPVALELEAPAQEQQSPQGADKVD